MNDKKLLFIVISVGVISLTLCFFSGYLFGVDRGLDTGFEKGLVVNEAKIVSLSPTTNGYAVGDDYFVVFTKDRDFDEIARTTFHELAHIYAYNDKQHFCNFTNSLSKQELLGGDY